MVEYDATTRSADDDDEAFEVDEAQEIDDDAVTKNRVNRSKKTRFGQ
jgi:hypothetical protein